MNWGKMPSLSALRAFDAVATHRSFSRAATGLNVTEAAIRQHVRGLENRLGLALVERTGRDIKLTPVGQKLADATHEGFGTIHSAVELLLAEETMRPLRVTVPPSFAENWLMPRLAEFWSDHPEIRIELVPSLNVLDMKHERLDLAIRYGHGDWDDCESRYLVSGEYLVVARTDTFSDKTCDDPASLKEQCWLFETGRMEHMRWVEKHGIEFNAATHRHYPTNSLVLSALRAGQGISLQSRALVQRDIDSGLLSVLYAEPSETLGYHAVVPPEPSPAVRKLLKWLENTT
ncbi:LysR family transcriptional regulator [uncultured Martelella sp.]|uniref:LysR family transcriptional regulator n=1 Tax=uncultured Martelella sp. TaxID=392331 RepID=UPI0029C8391A|nr:LysR family transcriptional regulator [uncultured Martelella sp.]